jgi:hypothetical protein
MPLLLRGLRCCTDAWHLDSEIRVALCCFRLYLAIGVRCSECRFEGWRRVLLYCSGLHAVHLLFSGKVMLLVNHLSFGVVSHEWWRIHNRPEMPFPIPNEAQLLGTRRRKKDVYIPPSSANLPRNSLRSSKTRFLPFSMNASNWTVKAAMRWRRSSKLKSTEGSCVNGLSVYEYEGVACDCEARKEDVLFMNVVPDIVVAIFATGLSESTQVQVRESKTCDK